MTHTRRTHICTHNICNITRVHTSYSLQPLSSSLQFYQRGPAPTGSLSNRQQLVPAGARGKYTTTCLVTGQTLLKPSFPVVYHMGPCAHSVGATVTGFLQVCSIVLSHRSWEPTKKQAWQPDRWRSEGQLCCSPKGGPRMGLPPLLVPSAICFGTSQEGKLGT